MSYTKKKIQFSRQILAKVGDIKFYGNLFSESRADISGQTDGRTGKTKLIDAFR